MNCCQSPQCQGIEETFDCQERNEKSTFSRVKKASD